MGFSENFTSNKPKVVKTKASQVKDVFDDTVKNLENIAPKKDLEAVIDGVMESNTVFDKSSDLESKLSEMPDLVEEFEGAAFAFFRIFGNGHSDAEGEVSGFFAKCKEFFGIEDSNEDDALETRALPDLSKEGQQGGSELLSSGPRRILQEALKSVGSDAFRGSEVDGGNLACAQVVSTILMRAGYLDKPNLSTARTVKLLKSLGWKVHGSNYKPKAGDVVVWNRTRKTANDGHVKLGYPHIGVAINEHEAVSNSSKQKMPRIHKMGRTPDSKYWYNRGIDVFLSPPDSVV